MKTKLEPCRDRGSSLVFSLLILFAMLALGVAGLSAARFGLTLSNNYKTGIQAGQAAESGLVHAVQAVSGYGIISYTDIASNWGTIFGNSALQMPDYSSISYTVTPATSPAATASNMWITSLGQAPGESQRILKARLGLGPPFTCGAIDLVSTGVSANFQGNSFEVDGRNYDPTQPVRNGPIPNSTPTLGISTRTQADANTVIDALASNEYDNVNGIPVGPHLPSVGPCSGVSVDRLRDVIVPAILAQPGVVNNPSLNGHDAFGSMAVPQITHFTGDLNVALHGDMQGAGILIVDGSLRVSGNIGFTGLIIVRGTTQVTVTGSSTVFGALWTTDLSLDVGGNAGVFYSNQALVLANSIPNTTGPTTVRRATVLAWSEG